MNKKIKILSITILFWAILSLFSTVNAASASIKASATSVTVGKKVTVTVTIKAAAWNVTVSGSASGKIAGADMSEKNVTTTKKYTITPSKAGKYTVKISGDVTDASGDEKTVSGSVTITAKAKTEENNNATTDNDDKVPAKKSSDATLSNLGVTPKKYDFTGFRKSITGSKAEYKVKVPNDVTKLSVYASTSSSKATYSVSGNTGFKVGTNIISVKVKAEDGTTKTYKIYVTREAKEEEVIPNITEDESGTENENVEEQLDDIGLKKLTVKGYELDSEFQSNVFDYIVVIGDDKFDSADSVKKLINAESNYEDAEVVVKVTEGSAEDSFMYQATISVADVEKEYASYTVKFVKSLDDAEEIEEEPVYPEEVETNTVIAPAEEKDLLFGYDRDTVEKLILIACIVIMLIISIVLGIIAYDKSSKLKIYEDAEEYEEELAQESDMRSSHVPYSNEGSINKTTEEQVNENNKENNTQAVEVKEVNTEKMVGEEIEKSEYYSSNTDRYEPRYRNPRNINKKGGRHF